MRRPTRRVTPPRAGTIDRMSVPGRVEAASLLLDVEAPTWLSRHARAVAEVASWLGRAVARRASCDRLAAETAALLHDVDKALPDAARERRLRHGDGSAAWLRSVGHPELAPLVADHPVTRLLEPAWPDWLATSAIEALIVAYADKRAGQRLEPMSSRFADWARRYRGPAGWSQGQQELAWTRALQLEARVCDAGGCRPEEVARIGWTGSALAAARRPGTAT